MRRDLRRHLRAAGRVGEGALTVLAALGGARAGHSLAISEQATQLAAVLAELRALHALRVEVTGAPPVGPSVLVANHVSYLDPVALAPVVPCIPISKGEVSGWPVIGFGARVLGVLFVDRASPLSGARALRRALRALRAGVSVLNFPEGTTTDGTRILPFRRGVFGVAQMARAPIVPVALRYESAALSWTGGEAFVPHYWRTAGRHESRVHLHFCDPLRPAHGDTAVELAAIARARIARALDLALDEKDPHVPAIRLRVPSPRPDPVLSIAAR
jgi:lyso-ornithine lipid O-acyltransferase